MKLTQEQIDSLCDYADSCRARGQGWEDIVQGLHDLDRKGELEGLTVGLLRGWHGTQQKQKYAAMKKQERQELRLDVPTASDMTGRGQWAEQGTVQGLPVVALRIDDTAETEAEEGQARSFSDEARELVRYLGGDLIGKGAPRWQFAGHRAMKVGQYFERREGPGELEGRRWLRSAVLIWCHTAKGVPELVEVYPEHRIKRVISPQPPWLCSETLRLEVFSLTNIGHVKSMQGLLEVEVRLKVEGLREREREVLERRKRRLEVKLAFGSAEAQISVLRVQQIVSRLATVMDLHCPELTGAGSGAALGAATARTRAAESAARLKLVEELAARTGGHGKYAGLRAGEKYAERGRGAAAGESIT